MNGMNIQIALIGEDDYKGNLRISGNQNIKKFVRSKKSKNILLLNTDIGFGLLSGQMNNRISLAQYGYYDDIVGVGGIYRYRSISVWDI